MAPKDRPIDDSSQQLATRAREDAPHDRHSEATTHHTTERTIVDAIGPQLCEPHALKAEHFCSRETSPAPEHPEASILSAPDCETWCAIYSVVATTTKTFLRNRRGAVIDARCTNIDHEPT